MFERHRIMVLIARFLNHTITLAEKKELEAWINASPDNQRFMEVHMRKEHALKVMTALTAMDSQRIRRNFEKKVGEPELHTLEDRSKARVYALAIAATMLAAVVGVWVFRASRGAGRSAETPTEVAVQMSENRAGRTKPVIIISDGSTVLLDEIPINGVVDKDNLRITRTAKRNISITSASGSQVVAILSKTVVAVPYGQHWQVSLPQVADVDVAPGGSLALLPSKGRATEYALDGEAYFEVAPNAQSRFTVWTNNLRTDVLGTAFNVYAQGNICATTLISGAIKVSKGSSSRVLAPGDEARVGDVKDTGIAVAKGVDTADRLTWRSPSFEFDNVNIKQFMQQVARWYGLKPTVFDKRVDTVTRGLLGGGHVGKDFTLPELLDLLRKENHLLFQVRTDSTIYVSPEPFTSLANKYVPPGSEHSTLFFFKPNPIMPYDVTSNH